MTIRERMQTKIPGRILFGIIIGILLAITVLVIYMLFIANAGTAQCGLPPMDIEVMKLDEHGNIQWETHIDSGGDDSASAVVQTPDGGYAVLALYSGRDSEGPNFFSRIVGLNRNGSIAGESRYTRSEWRFNSLFTNPDGGYYAGAWYPGRILVLDGSGEVIKTIRFGDATSPSFFVPRSEPGFVAALESSSGQNTRIMSLDPDGNILWLHNDTSLVALQESSLLATPDGGCIAGGHTPGGHELSVIRYDSSGTELWNATLGKSRDNRLIAMAEPRPGDYEILYESTRGTGSSPAIVMETYSVTFDSNGTVLRQWMPDISPPIVRIPERDYLAVRLPEKGYGSSYGFGMPHLIVRLTDGGIFEWQTPVPADWYDVTSIVPTGDGGCVVLGSRIQNDKNFFCL